MRKAAAEMHVYPDGGVFYLRKAVAAKLDIPPDSLVFGNGSNELIELLAHVFLDAGREVVVAERAFIIYQFVARAFRSNPVVVPMEAFRHDLPAMLAAITPETRLVFVSNPNNPTGTMVGQGEIDRFMAGVPDHVVVVFDEAYIELLPASAQPDTLKFVREGRNVVVLRTFSKTYGLAGLRLGYAVAPASGAGLLQRVRQPFNVNAMAQAAALAALEDEEHVERTRRLVSEGLDFLAGACGALDLEFVPSVANFMLIRVGDGRAAFEALQRQGVIVRPMDVYGLPEYVRVTVGTAGENEKLMARIRDWLG
jgi:histidinol-phosphate aminotransferase